MIAVRNWFPNGCAAPNGCDDPLCAMCETATALPVRAGTMETIRESESSNAARDGSPTLAGERKRGNKAFRATHREGPNYVPRNARV